MTNVAYNTLFEEISQDVVQEHPHMEKYEEYRDLILEREQQKFEDFQLKDFVLMSANLQNFLPEVPVSEYKDIYMRILLGRALLAEQPQHVELIGRVHTHQMEEALRPQNLPAVFCTYHLGSYRAIIGLLAKLGIPFILIVDAKTYHVQGAQVRNQVAAFHSAYGQEGTYFDVINAELPNSAMTMLKYLKEGISVLAYIDGNTGGGGIFHKNDRFQLKIPFLQQEILSRKGIAAISWMSKRPIIPVISYYEEDSIIPHIQFFDPVFPQDWKQAPKTYVPVITRKLYRILESYLVDYYDQWETWFYLHKYLDADGIKSLDQSKATNLAAGDNWQYSFNRVDFDLFKMGEDHYLFNKRTYQTFPIEGDLFEALLKVEAMSEKGLLEVGFPKSLIEQLVDNQILQPHQTI
jgi:lauroyl/myristoyl acyltransferase